MFALEMEWLSSHCSVYNDNKRPSFVCSFIPLSLLPQAPSAAAQRVGGSPPGELAGRGAPAGQAAVSVPQPAARVLEGGLPAGPRPGHRGGGAAEDRLGGARPLVNPARPLVTSARPPRAERTQDSRLAYGLVTHIQHTHSLHNNSNNDTISLTRCIGSQVTQGASELFDKKVQP